MYIIYEIEKDNPVIKILKHTHLKDMADIFLLKLLSEKKYPIIDIQYNLNDICDGSFFFKNGDLYELRCKERSNGWLGTTIYDKLISTYVIAKIDNPKPKEKKNKPSYCDVIDELKNTFNAKKNEK